MNLYKKTVSYALLAMSTSLISGNEPVSENLYAVNTGPILSLDVDNNTQIQARADELCALYLDNLYDAHKKLGDLSRNYYSTTRYTSAVRNYLGPDTPVRRHCVNGARKELLRATDSVGDTIKIFPDGVDACITFERQMKQMYPNATRRGRLYKTRGEYNMALAKFDGDSAEFAKTNICVPDLNPGAVMLVPRGRGNWHMITYAGIENGIPKYLGHNRESYGNLFSAFNTTNVFVADINKIARIKYESELYKIMKMDFAELVNYLSDGDKDAAAKLSNQDIDTLRTLARGKYFNRSIQKSVRQNTGIQRT